MVFNATFNNMSVKSWRSVLLMEETGIPGENQRPIAKEYIFYTLLRKRDAGIDLQNMM